MDYAIKQPRHHGIKAVIFDMAGTIVDYGSCAPAHAFVELFRRNQVDITPEQARGPMGMGKKDHIRTLTRHPDIARLWNDTHNAPCTEADVERMYGEFVPLQIECLADFSTLIPGALEALEWLRAQGIKVGATTGYNTDMMRIVLDKITEQGFKPDAAVCVSDVPTGRPAPWMIFRCLQNLGVYPPEAVVKIGDTIPDIAAGRNAGVWSVGFAKTGNMLGLNHKQVQGLAPDALRARLDKARKAMLGAGAHFVLDGVAETPGLIESLTGLLSQGKRP